MKKMIKTWPLNMALDIWLTGELYQDWNLPDEELKKVTNQFMLDKIAGQCDVILEKYMKTSFGTQDDMLLLVKHYKNGDSLKNVANEAGITYYQMRKIKKEFIGSCRYESWMSLELHVEVEKLFILLNHDTYPYNVIAMLEPKFHVMIDKNALTDSLTYIFGSSPFTNGILREFFEQLFVYKNYDKAVQYSYDTMGSHEPVYELTRRKSDEEIQKDIDRAFKIRCVEVERMLTRYEDLLIASMPAYLKQIEMENRKLHRKCDAMQTYLRHIKSDIESLDNELLEIDKMSNKADN